MVNGGYRSKIAEKNLRKPHILIQILKMNVCSVEQRSTIRLMTIFAQKWPKKLSVSADYVPNVPSVLNSLFKCSVLMKLSCKKVTPFMTLVVMQDSNAIHDDRCDAGQ